MTCRTYRKAATSATTAEADKPAYLCTARRAANARFCRGQGRPLRVRRDTWAVPTYSVGSRELRRLSRQANGRARYGCGSARASGGRPPQVFIHSWSAYLWFSRLPPETGDPRREHRSGRARRSWTEHASNRPTRRAERWPTRLTSSRERCGRARRTCGGKGARGDQRARDAR
jgi:hypothetical protein